MAFVSALPCFISRKLEIHEINLPTIESVSICYEDWPHEYGRAMYSAVVMLLQYCFPILTLVLTYTRICNRLRKRVISAEASEEHDSSRRREARIKKTKKLLVSLTLMFCLSWLPLNLYNIIVDIKNPFEDTELMLIVYAICHMIGMSSACFNPLLYGWLNTNFRNEFFEILENLCPCCWSATDTENYLCRNGTRASFRVENLSVLEVYPNNLKKSSRRYRRKEEMLKEKLRRSQTDSSSSEIRETNSLVALVKDVNGNKKIERPVKVEQVDQETTTIF